MTIQFIVIDIIVNDPVSFYTFLSHLGTFNVKVRLYNL